MSTSHRCTILKKDLKNEWLSLTVGSKIEVSAHGFLVREDSSLNSFLADFSIRSLKKVINITDEAEGLFVVRVSLISDAAAVSSSSSSASSYPFGSDFAIKFPSLTSQKAFLDSCSRVDIGIPYVSEEAALRELQHSERASADSFLVPDMNKEENQEFMLKLLFSEVTNVL